MQKNEATADKFEKLSKSIVEYLLQDSNARITQTRSRKDGGYDIVVEYCDGLVKQCAFFECKLRKGNLNLRDIAANVIIAFNHGAVAMVAVTNHDFTQQTGEELTSFCQHTVLNIKIIVGVEVQHLIEQCGEPITDELRSYLDIKRTHRKDDFCALRINFNEDVLCQIFNQSDIHKVPADPLIEYFYSEKIDYILKLLQTGYLVSVSGYLGVGKRKIIQAVLAKINKRIISIDATLHNTKDIVILDLLAQIWGIPVIDIFNCFSKNDIEAITEVVGDIPNSEETIEILTGLLNENYADKRATERQNALLSDYISKLINLHKNNIEYVVYINKLQFASKEIYDFLIYLIKYLSQLSISCIITYQEPEYKLQEGQKPLERLKYVEKYKECQIKPFNNTEAIAYVKCMYPEMSSYVAQLIVSKVGTRLYNLSYLLKSFLPSEIILPSDSKAIANKLKYLTPNNIPNQLEQILPQYQIANTALFETCFLLDCRVPIEICGLLDISPQNLDNMENAGVFQCKQGMITAQNEFVHDWIMNAYFKNSPSIQLRARELLKLLELQSISYNAERISLYHVLGLNESALTLLEKDIRLLKREKQYTLLRGELALAIELAKSSRNYTKEADYLISLLETITIQKEINTDEAEKRIMQLESCMKHKKLPEYCTLAVSFFKLKRAFKSGQYTKEADNSIQIGERYYKACLERQLTDNSDDLLGRICACYALFIKETQGNESALTVFENALKVLPTSFELRREYYSHIACMQLYEKPLSAFSNYKKIFSLFEKEAPDSAALPFHEYGDLAMSQLMAENFDYALELAEEALEIGRSNGLADEEGRCLNIRGCVEWCLGDLQAAENSFREATAIMCYSGYSHYAWRSQINLLQLTFFTDNYENTRATMLENVYSDFVQLLAGKIDFLIKYNLSEFRKTREYHALLAFGVLWSKVWNEPNSYKKICNDFKLGEYCISYKNDLDTFLSGDYNFMESPYIRNGYIYFVG